MKTNGPKYWFPAKKYGWGWGPPCAWQGWVIWLLWLGMLLAGGLILAPRSVALFVVYSLFLGAALMAVTIATGEKPRWRWGEGEVEQTGATATQRLAELEELRGRSLISDAEYQAKRQEILKEL